MKTDRKLFFVVLVLMLLTFLTPALTYATPLLLPAPLTQTPLPDPNAFIVYGVSWALVGAVVMGLLMRYAGLTEAKAAIVTAAWTTFGYLLIQNLPALERLAPWIPTYLPQVLTAIILFGAQLGIIQVARVGYRVATRR